jgi:DNA-binding CsgD family transcriptional regulator
MEIVQLLATGATNQQIAQDLVISVNTVKVHLRNIYAKLNVASRTEATMVAVREGWVGVPRTAAEVEAAAEAVPEPPPSALPQLEGEPRVSVAKRISLVVAILLAAAFLLLPFVLQGRANGGNDDPIGSVFPTAPSGESADRWRTHAQMPTPRNGLAVVAHNDLIYAIGGVSNEGVTGKLEVYDPLDDAWTTGSPKPTPVGFVSAAVVGDLIYVPGGIGLAGGNGADREFEDVLEVYDPDRDVWEVRAPMPIALGAYGLAAQDGQLYLFGGLGEEGYVASVLHYNPQADRWEELKPMAQPRGFLSAAAWEDRIYVVGGYDDADEFNNCDAFDPATGTWTSLSPMDQGRGGLAVVTVREQLYAIGGGMTAYLAFNERYDARLDTWNPIETPVTGLWRGLGAAFVYPNIYAIGGWSAGNLSVNEAYQALFQITVPLGPP